MEDLQERVEAVILLEVVVSQAILVEEGDLANHLEVEAKWVILKVVEEGSVVLAEEMAS